MWWHSTDYYSLAAVEKSGVQLHYRWTDYRIEEKLLSRFLTAYTAEEMIFTMSEAEAEGRLRLKLIEQAGEDLEFNDRWREIGSEEIARLRRHKPTFAERKLFRTIPDNVWQETLEEVLEMLSSVIFLKKDTAGHDWWNPTEEQRLEMSFYEALKTFEDDEERAARFLVTMAVINGHDTLHADVLLSLVSND